jgi:hypothetical protein
MSEDKEPIEDSNWLTDPAFWDLCDEHETTFPMGSHCPKCLPIPTSGSTDADQV